MRQRSIPACIILTILTCGIYGIYWFVCLTNDLNQVTGTPNDTSGGTALIFDILTCGIYGIYWNYKMGRKVDQLQEYNGVPNQNNAILYLILSLVGLSIINFALMQDNLNRCAPPPGSGYYF